MSFPVTFTGPKASEVELRRTRGTVAGAAVAAVLLAAASAHAEDAAKNYAAKCQACHGVDGKAAFVEMNLADDKWLHGGSLADVVKTIENGVPGKAMISFKAQLTKPEIDALAKYVRTFSKKAKGAK